MRLGVRPAVLGSLESHHCAVKTTETLVQRGDPNLVSQRSRRREGCGLRTWAPLCWCRKGGGETGLLRVALQGTGWRPGLAPGGS